MSISAKYEMSIENTEIKLAEMRMKLETIKKRIDVAEAHRRIVRSEQLTKALAQAEHYLELVESKLEQRRQANDAVSEDMNRAFDQSWEDLALSIKNVVSRFS